MVPTVHIDHDRERYRVQVELPEMNMDDIELEVSENGFCIKGSGKDSDIVGCYQLAHPVDQDNVYATFDKGVLSVEIPLKFPIRGRRVEIHQGPGDIDQMSGRELEKEEGRRSIGTGTQ